MLVTDYALHANLLLLSVLLPDSIYTMYIYVYQLYSCNTCMQPLAYTVDLHVLHCMYSCSGFGSVKS